MKGNFGHVILSVILWNILVLSNITLNAAPLKKKQKHVPYIKSRVDRGLNYKCTALIYDNIHFIKLYILLFKQVSLFELGIVLWLCEFELTEINKGITCDIYLYFTDVL